jgi:enoyl-CoA hydratase/carnithine racemase
MSHVELTQTDDVAIVALNRGKVNALNHTVVRELADQLRVLETSDGVGAVVLTGSGKFFTFGFDIPEFLSFSKPQFTEFLTDFTDLYRQIFLFPKPVVAGLNGHTIAGGCMLALACDRRVMANGKAKISLNESTFGASVFAGCAAMLRARVGQRKAETILYSGDMYGAEAAAAMGLVDRVAPVDELLGVAVEEARVLASKDPTAFHSIKALLRGPIADEFERREAAAVREFAEIWYSAETWENLQKIEIRR